MPRRGQHDPVRLRWPIRSPEADRRDTPGHGTPAATSARSSENLWAATEAAGATVVGGGRGQHWGSCWGCFLPEGAQGRPSRTERILMQRSPPVTLTRDHALGCRPRWSRSPRLSIRGPRARPRPHATRPSRLRRARTGARAAQSVHAAPRADHASLVPGRTLVGGHRPRATGRHRHPPAAQWPRGSYPGGRRGGRGPAALIGRDDDA